MSSGLFWIVNLGWVFCFCQDPITNIFNTVVANICVHFSFVSEMSAWNQSPAPPQTWETTGNRKVIQSKPAPSSMVFFLIKSPPGTFPSQDRGLHLHKPGYNIFRIDTEHELPFQKITWGSAWLTVLWAHISMPWLECGEWEPPHPQRQDYVLFPGICECGLVWKKHFCKCPAVQDLEKSNPGLSTWAPNPMTNVLIRDTQEEEEKDTRGRDGDWS